MRQILRYHALMIDPAVGALLAGVFALLFASAALHKLAGLMQFLEVFRAYAVVPASLTPLAALVPLLELAVSAALLASRSRTAAAAAGIGLLLAYAAALGLNLARGRRDLDCGCGAAHERRPIAPWMVWRNLILACLLGATLLPWARRPLEMTDALTIGAGTAVAALLYISFDSLFGRLMMRTAQWRTSVP
jgi:hypothetical protein